MTTTTQDIVAVLAEQVPVQPTRLDLALERLIVTSRALGRAHRALNGQLAGQELDNRVRAFQAASAENLKSISEQLDAEAAEAAASEGSA